MTRIAGHCNSTVGTNIGAVMGFVGVYIERMCVGGAKSRDRSGQFALGSQGQGPPSPHRVACNNLPQRRAMINLTGVAAGGIVGAHVA